MYSGGAISRSLMAIQKIRNVISKKAKKLCLYMNTNIDDKASKESEMKNITISDCSMLPALSYNIKNIPDRSSVTPAKFGKLLACHKQIIIE